MLVRQFSISTLVFVLIESNWFSIPNVAIFDLLTFPLSGRVEPLRILIKVLFPPPFLPTMPIRSLSAIPSETFLINGLMSNDFEMEINFGNTLLGMVAENGTNINIPNASKV
jgi:hypothetical protein